MNTTTLDIGKSGWRLRVGLADALTSLVLIAGAAYALNRYGASMDVYETWILIGAVPSLIGLVWLWPTLRGLSL
ncbi:MAG: c-type cytochrome biosis protein CcsB, partial [Pseudomonadota bacterium]